MISMGTDYGPARCPTQRMVLASSSPRRRELLRRISPAFRAVVPHFEELPIWAPGDLVEAARGKMLAVRQREPQALIVAADTGVFLQGQHLGKPAHLKEAREFLRALSGRWHSVFTGLCISPPGTSREELVETRVLFRELNEEELDWYLAVEDVSDKAGAYAIQGKAAAFVDRIEGDYANVMGLPLATLYSALQELGWRPDRERPSVGRGG